MDEYSVNAEAYVARTASLDLRSLHDHFLPRIPVGGTILDAGCGSGRDAAAFAALGYQVHAFDQSPEMVTSAKTRFDGPVTCVSFSDFESEHVFDGIWACASLLHVDRSRLASTVSHLSSFLRDDAPFYMSFKVGEGDRVDPNGRPFTDFTADGLRGWSTSCPELRIDELWISKSLSPGCTENWLNVILLKVGA